MDMTDLFDRWEKDKERIAELEECNEEWRLDFASLEGENKRLEQQLAELRDAAQAVLIHRDLDGGDFNDAVDDLAALLKQEGGND